LGVKGLRKFNEGKGGHKTSKIAIFSWNHIVISNLTQPLAEVRGTQKIFCESQVEKL
jgi:hypothetical protein